MKTFITGSTLALMFAASPVLAQIVDPAAPPPQYSRIIDSKGVVLSNNNGVRQITAGVWVTMQGAGYVRGLIAVEVPLLYASKNCKGTPYIFYSVPRSDTVGGPETLDETLTSPGYLTGQVDGSGFIVGAARLFYAGRAQVLPRTALHSINFLNQDGAYLPCGGLALGDSITVGKVKTIQLPIFTPPFMLSN